jgi:hypothetical protein
VTVDYVAKYAEEVHAVADRLHALADRLKTACDDPPTDEEHRIGRYPLSAHEVLSVLSEGVADLRAVDLISAAADADW